MENHKLTISFKIRANSSSTLGGVRKRIIEALRYMDLDDWNVNGDAE